MFTRKYSQFFLLLTLALSLSSCFHIVEEITLRKDGSGVYTFYIDGGEVKSFIEGIQGKSTNPAQDTAQTQVDSNQVDKAVRMVQGLPGITNARSLRDSSSLRFGYTFDFDQTNHMVSAIKSGPGKLGMGLWNEESKLEFSGKKLTRYYGEGSFRDFLVEMLTAKGASEGKEVSGMEGIMRMMFRSMSIKQIYHFPDRRIKSANHPSGRISSDKHTLTIHEAPFGDSDNKAKKAPQSLTIKLK